MPRRGENIYKRADGRFEGRYIKGRTEHGKAVYGYVYGRKYKDVKAKLLPLKAKYAATVLIIEKANTMLGDWLIYWLNEIAKPNIKQSTYSAYYGMINRNIIPMLGDKQLERLTSEELNQFIYQLRIKGLGTGTIRGIFRILNTILKEAVKAHVITVNPCDSVRLPKQARININVLTVAEQNTLEQASIKDKNGVAVILALYTGMRIGEICALRWQDIDFAENMIRIHQTVQRITNVNSTGSKTGILFDMPKSESSCRSIPITNNLASYLQEYRENTDSSYVISCKGSFAEPRVVEYRFQKLLEKTGLRQIHFHALRHTFATRCMEVNVDITTLSKLLGHSSVKMTLDTYTDSVMEQRRAAIMMLDKHFQKQQLQ